MGIVGGISKFLLLSIKLSPEVDKLGTNVARVT